MRQQGQIKPRVDSGPDVHSGSIFWTIPKFFNIFHELKYIMWPHESVLVGVYCSKVFKVKITFINKKLHFIVISLPLSMKLCERPLGRGSVCLCINQSLTEKLFWNIIVYLLTLFHTQEFNCTLLLFSPKHFCSFM